MSLFRIASWNVEGRLSDQKTKTRGKPEDIIKAIKEIDADILFLAEAHTETSLDNFKSRQQLLDMGYEVCSVPYQEDITDIYSSQLSLMLLSKPKIVKIETVRLGDFRNALVATIANGEDNRQLKIFGVHLDDKSETTRLKQISDLSSLVNESKLPTIVLGDFNAMHGEDWWPSKFLQSRIVRMLAHVVLPVLSIRATEMARGEALDSLEKRTWVIDADAKHRPTATPKMRGIEWLPSVRLLQIDHIFISGNIEVKDFKIMPDRGSDHRAIVSNLIIK